MLISGSEHKAIYLPNSFLGFNLKVHNMESHILCQKRAADEDGLVARRRCDFVAAKMASKMATKMAESRDATWLTRGPPR